MRKYDCDIKRHLLPRINSPVAGCLGTSYPPRVSEVVIEKDEWKEAEFERRVPSKPFDDLPGALIFFVGVKANQIEVKLVRVRLGEKIAAAGEISHIEELIFFQVMEGVDSALISMSGRRDAHVLARSSFFLARGPA